MTELNDSQNREEEQANAVGKNANLDKPAETEPDVISDATISTDQEKEPAEANQDEAKLPDGVTLAPRNAEEMHLDLIQDQNTLVKAYLAVSDDQGEQLGDVDLEKKVKEFCELHQNVAKAKIDNPNQLLQETKDLLNEYSPAVNLSEAISKGTDTKYRIREGMLYSIEKDIVRKMGENWIDSFKLNHGATSLRSAQDYMALAKVPNIIRYAVLGKKRLMEIQRAVKGSKDPDPIGQHLENHGIKFDPASDVTEMTEQIRIQIDAVIAMTKIDALGEKKDLDLDVSFDLLTNLIALGTKFDTGIVRDLIIIKENGGDINQYLENRYISGGAEDQIVKSTKKVTGFPKLVASLGSTISYIKEHEELAAQINPSQIDDLEVHISDLKALISNS